MRSPHRTRPRRSQLILALVAALLTTPASTPAVGAEPRARSGSGATQLAWSRFVDLDFSTARIVVRRPGDGPATAITSPGPGEVDLDPAVSPDGRWVTFERDFPDGRAEVGLVRSNGTGERLLTSLCVDPCEVALAPTWAPDGRHLVFTRVVGPFDQPNGSARSAVLMTTDLHGRSVKRLSQPGIDGAFEDYHASFAPDGYVVFVRIDNVRGRSAVFRMSAKAHQVRRLTPWRLDADIPQVSSARTGPGEDLVVFETFGHGPPEGVSQAIATVPATCRPVARCAQRIRLLTSPHVQPVQNFNPSWSPNGRRIAYVRFRSVVDGPPHGDIWTMGSRGQGKRRVSTSRLFEFRPSWGVAPSSLDQGA